MAATMFDATVKLEHTDSQDVSLGTLIQKDMTEFGHTAGTENTDAQTLPKVKMDYPRKQIMKQDDKLKVMIYLNTAATEAGSSNALVFKFRIPVTMKNIRSGAIFENTLVWGQFTAKMTSTASKVWAVSNWLTIAEYSVPAQVEIKLGQAIQDARVDSALSIYGTYVA